MRNREYYPKYAHDPVTGQRKRNKSKGKKKVSGFKGRGKDKSKEKRQGKSTFAKKENEEPVLERARAALALDLSVCSVADHTTRPSAQNIRSQSVAL